MIRLDTHVAVWLYAGDTDRLSPTAIEMIESNPVVISPMVQLELTYLHEIGRLRVGGSEIVGDLRQRIGLRLSDASLGGLVEAAAPLSWTRDPFDRMIVADALLATCDLLTKDSTISENCSLAIW